MEFTAQWANKRETLIHVNFQGSWNWQHFYAAAGEVAHMMITVGHPVDVILDTLDSSLASSDGFHLHIRRTAFYRGNIGTVVIIQGSKNMSVVSTTLQDLFSTDAHGRIVFASSLEQAQTIIDKHQTVREETRRNQNRRFLKFLTH